MRTAAAAIVGLLLAFPVSGASPAAKPVAKLPCDLVIVAGAALPMDAAFTVRGATAVAIRGGAILAVGDPAAIDGAYLPKERIVRTGGVLLPGFVNTHTHAAMDLLRGISNDQPLMEWLTKFIFPAEAKNVSPAFVRAGTDLACLEMIRGGTTTFADMYYYESDVAASVDKAGLRAVLGETWLDFPAPGHANLEESKTVTRAFLEKWKGHPRVTAAIAPHAPYTCSRETLQAARALADEYGAPLLTHLSETQDEQKQILEKYGKSPTAWLDEIGFLGPRLSVAHGVWLSPEDLKVLAERKVSLSHNPESNMKLGSGIAPIAAARKAGVVVGLGTDGAAGSNNDLDMLDAMDFAGKLAKVSALDPTPLTAPELLRMATIDGAKALGLDRLVGSLEPGKRADVIVVELENSHSQPVFDLASTVVYASRAGDVSLTLVDGKVLWDGKSVRTLDEVKVLAAAKEWRGKVLKSLEESGEKK
ncbi:MAG TPA: amidohydrolase family protein [Thermoanaerobaculia bacterium]|nr:amidohydrolase family protein [Thermoanaerobaculia bacterium]